jgi:HK97 family phage major capsid protein/HK97 family phage prohead protease
LKKLLDKTKKQTAFSLLTVKDVSATPGKATVITGIATTPTPDRVDDIVEPLGVTFKNPLPLLWQHDMCAPIGTVVFDAPTAKGITFTATIPYVEEEGDLKDRIDEAVQSVKYGLVRGVSIGFRPLEYNWMEDGGIRFVESEVYELSLVTIPANADATIDSVKAMFKTNASAAIGHRRSGVKAGVSVTTKSAKSKQPVSIISKKETPLEAIKKQIEDFLESKSLKSDRQAEIIKDASGSTFDDAQSAEFDGLEEEIEAIDSHVKRLESTLKRIEANASTAKPVNKSASVAAGSATRSHAVAKNTETLDKGIRFARWAICLASAKGNLMQAQQIAANRYGDDEDINLAMKAAVAAGSTTDPTWAGPLVFMYQRFAGDFVEFLRPQTIIGKFGQNGIPGLRHVPFNISIVGQTSGGSGYWVGEGQAKPLTKFDFNEIHLRWAKVANIAVLTQELVRFSNPAAEALVRNSLADALIARLDTDFVDPAKALVANISPASITNGVTGVASSGNDAAAVRQDVKALFTKYIQANQTPTNGVWIMSGVNALALSLMITPLGTREFPGITMMGGVFEGLPVIVSEYTPPGTVILANASDIYLSDDGQVVIDASSEATLQMDTAPTQAGLPATPTTGVSMFQTNSIALRAERWINWQKRRAEAVQMLTGVAWGDPVTP